MEPERKAALSSLQERFRSLREGGEDFTLVLVDPPANSYIYSPFAPRPDPRLTIEEYDRTEEENEELGLNDMQVRGEKRGGTER